MSTETGPAEKAASGPRETTEDDTGSETRPDPFAVLQAAKRDARANDIPHGPGRAAWVLAEYQRRLAGERVVMRGHDRCTDCEGEKETGRHLAVRLVLPSDHSASGRDGAVLAGPFCPACAVDRVTQALR